MKLSDVDPDVYLCFALTRIADHAINRIDQLMPWVVADQLRVNAKNSCAPVKTARMRRLRAEMMGVTLVSFAGALYNGRRKPLRLIGINAKS